MLDIRVGRVVSGLDASRLRLVVRGLRVGRGVSVFVARLSKPTRLDICHPLNEKTIIRIFDSRWKAGCGFVEGDKR